MPNAARGVAFRPGSLPTAPSRVRDPLCALLPSRPSPPRGQSAAPELLSRCAPHCRPPEAEIVARPSVRAGSPPATVPRRQPNPCPPGSPSSICRNPHLVLSVRQPRWTPRGWVAGRRPLAWASGDPSLTLHVLGAGGSERLLSKGAKNPTPRLSRPAVIGRSHGWGA